MGSWTSCCKQIYRSTSLHFWSNPMPLKSCAFSPSWPRIIYRMLSLHWKGMSQSKNYLLVWPWLIIVYILVHTWLLNELISITCDLLRRPSKLQMVGFFLKQTDITGSINKILAIGTLLDQTTSFHQWHLFRDEHDTLRCLFLIKLLLIGSSGMKGRSNDIHFTHMPSTITMPTHTILRTMMTEVDIL